jgi:hypothetical protein
MWVGSMTHMEYVNCIPQVSWTNQDYLFTIHTIKVELGNLGGIMLPALCAGIIIHLMNIHRKHYSF